VLAERDLQGGGTWIDDTRNAHFAALTNYRKPTIAFAWRLGA